MCVLDNKLARYVFVTISVSPNNRFFEEAIAMEVSVTRQLKGGKSTEKNHK